MKLFTTGAPTLTSILFVLPATGTSLGLVGNLKRQMPKTQYNIHPNSDTTRSIGVLRGKFVAGSAVDMYVPALLP